MPHDCPHDHCQFFVASANALCPACGLPSGWRGRSFLGAGRRVLPWFAVVASALLVGLALFGWWFVLPIGLVVVSGGFVLLEQRRFRSPSFGTLDSLYNEATTESAHWLAKWTELFSLNESANALADDERQLIEEAKDAAAEAAAAATARRNEYGRRYLANGFDRLDHLVALRPGRRADLWERQWIQALAVIEDYLETLWIDHHIVDQARKHLATLCSQQLDVTRRHDLVGLIATVTVLEDVPAAPEVPPATAVAADHADDPIATHRRRLRIERQLLSDAPLPAEDVNGSQ